MEKDNVIPLRKSYAIFNPELRQNIDTTIQPLVQEKSGEVINAVESAISVFVVTKFREAFTQLGKDIATAFTKKVDKGVYSDSSK